MSQALTLDKILQKQKLNKNELKVLKLLRDSGEYGNDFYKEYSKIEDISSARELGRKFCKSSFIYFGDYHTAIETQKSIAKGIDRILKNFDAVIYIEFINKKYQRLLNAYLKNEISEEDLFRKTGFYLKWNLKTEGYANILRIAKEYGAEVIAANVDTDENGRELDLNERDEKASEIITEKYSSSKNKKHIIIYGQHHLAKKHLIEKVEKKTDNSNYTIILQNLDHLYYKAKNMNPEANIIKLKKNVFCIFCADPELLAKRDLDYHNKFI